jgi:hypothetical protein
VQQDTSSDTNSESTASLATFLKWQTLKYKTLRFKCMVQPSVPFILFINTKTSMWTISRISTHISLCWMPFQHSGNKFWRHN